MTAIAYPYLRIDPAEVMADPWTIDDGGWRVIGEYLPDWDYASELRVRRRVRVDHANIAKRFGIPPGDLRLALVVTFGTGGAREDRLRRRVWAQDVVADETDFEIDLLLDGLDIAQRFSLRTDILLASPAGVGSPLAPKQPGLRLWDEMLRVRTEPDEARFPIEALAFSQHFPDHRNAPWILEWTPAQIEEDFEGAFRLFINDDFRDFVSKVSLGDATILKLLMGGVRLQIVRGVLGNEEFDAVPTEESPLSIAAAVRRWLALAFPGEDIAAVRELAVYSPAKFEAGISGVGEEAAAIA